MKKLSPEEGWIRGGVPTKTLGFKGGWMGGGGVSHIDRRREQVPALSPEGGWTRGGVPTRTMGLRRGGLRGPISIGEGNECKRGHWAPKGGGL